MTLMSLKSGTLNFYKVCRLFGVSQVQNGKDDSLAVLSFLFVYFLTDDLFHHPIFIYQNIKTLSCSRFFIHRFLIGCIIRDN